MEDESCIRELHSMVEAWPKGLRDLAAEIATERDTSGIAGWHYYSYEWGNMTTYAVLVTDGHRLAMIALDGARIADHASKVTAIGWTYRGSVRPDGSIDDTAMGDRFLAVITESKDDTVCQGIGLKYLQDASEILRGWGKLNHKAPKAPADKRSAIRRQYEEERNRQSAMTGNCTVDCLGRWIMLSADGSAFVLTMPLRD